MIRWTRWYCSMSQRFPACGSSLVRLACAGRPTAITGAEAHLCSSARSKLRADRNTRTDSWHLLDEIRQFFDTYKELDEGDNCRTDHFDGPDPRRKGHTQSTYTLRRTRSLI